MSSGLDGLIRVHRGVSRGNAIRAVACVIGLAALSASTRAAELEFSRFDTHYVASSGESVHALVTLNGDEGTYELVDYGEVGRLYNIRYFREGGAFRITGNWSFSGSRGRFEWQSNPNNPQTFFGSWGYGSSVRDELWSGRLLGGSSSGGGGHTAGCRRTCPTVTYDPCPRYTAWHYNCQRNRYECQVHYTDKQGEPACQLVVCYDPADDCRRAGWYYYYAPGKSTPWGRCMAPCHSDFDADTVQWGLLDDGSWVDVEPGVSPAAGNASQGFDPPAPPI